MLLCFHVLRIFDQWGPCDYFSLITFYRCYIYEKLLFELILYIHVIPHFCIFQAPQLKLLTKTIRAYHLQFWIVNMHFARENNQRYGNFLFLSFSLFSPFVFFSIFFLSSFLFLSIAFFSFLLSSFYKY